MVRNCLNFFRKGSWSKSLSISIDKRNGDAGYTAGRKTEIILLRVSEVKPGSSEKAQEEECTQRWGHGYETMVGIRWR